MIQLIQMLIAKNANEFLLHFAELEFGLHDKHASYYRNTS